MASYADVEKYDELIKELGDFCISIQNARENMLKNSKACQDIMGNDDISTNAGANIQEACKKYLNVCTKAQELRKKLSQERQHIIELLNELKRMDG